MPEIEEDILERIDALALNITENRQKGLLVLYYPEEDGEVVIDDISDIDDELRRCFGASKVDEIDILIHTNGGSPDAAYRIVQHIRSIANNVYILVPFHAYSAGTLICFGTDKILLGTFAALSPIDIKLKTENDNSDEIEENDNDDEIELIAIDKYIEFVKYCKKIIEDAGMKTNLEDALLVEMVKQIGAINIGSFFRERELTKYYAEILLSDYMLKDIPDKEKIIDYIIEMMVFKFPSHEFEIDYNIAKRLKLVVENMPIDLSDKTKSLIKLLEEAMENGLICRYMGNRYRLPFFRLYNIREE